IYLTYFLALSATKSAIEDGSLPVIIGLWPINAALLIAALIVNTTDSIPMRRFRDRWKQRARA
ncbi:MAG: LPS export ABC transporter permease LptF, partial [Shewanella sp.]